MRRFGPTAAALAVLVAPALAGAAGRLKVYGGITPNVIDEGGAAELKLVVEGPAADVSTLDLPTVDGLAFLDPEKTTSFEAVFTQPGGMQQQVKTEWRVRVVALRAGNYRIPPFPVRARGKVARTPQLRLRVTPAKAGGDKALAWLKATPSSRELYVGEPLRVSLELGLRLPHANNEIPDRRLFSPPSIEPAQGLEPMATGTPVPASAEHTLSVPIAGGKTIRFEEDAAAGGTMHRVFRAELAWIPQQPGTYEFGEARYASQMATRVERVRDFFEDRYIAREVRSALGTSKPFTVHVRPVPTQGRPTDFSGLIGRVEQEVHVDRRRVAVGESLKLTREISGTGNLDLIDPPSINLPASFKTFGTLIQRENGKVRQIVDLSPRDATANVIPPIALTAFDTERGVYVTLRSRPIPLNVQGAQGEGLTLLPRNVATGDDLRGVKTTHRPGVAWVPSARFTGALVGGPLLLGFIGLALGRRRRQRGEDPAAVRRRGAVSAFRKRIQEARAAVNDGADSRASAHALRIALAELLGDLTNSPRARFEADLREPLRDRIGDALLKKLVGVSEQIDHVTFGAGEGQLDRLMERMLSLAKEIEKEL